MLWHRLSFSLISDTQGYRLTEAGAVPGDHASATPRVQAAATLIHTVERFSMEGRSNPHRCVVVGFNFTRRRLELHRLWTYTRLGFARSHQHPPLPPSPAALGASRAGGSGARAASREGSTSLFRCVDLSEEHAGAPACISLAAKTAIVIELSAGNTSADGLGG